MSPGKSLKGSLPVEAKKPEWDPKTKEAWHLELEKQPVNDKKWSCIVTAAVPTEAKYQEYIQQYNQFINQGLRKAIKTLTMDDVIKLLKGSNNNSTKQNTKNVKNKKENVKKSESTIKSPDSPFSQILDLAAKYAVVIDNDCKLPPDLMAAVLKYLILKLKDENCLEKKKNIVREKKIRERNLKAKFIRDHSLFEKKEKESAVDPKFSEESVSPIHDEEPIHDEPIDGPDLYVLLIDFYDYDVFTELRRLNLLFLAIIEISVIEISKLMKNLNPPNQKSDPVGQKQSLILSFWEKHNSEIKDVEKVDKYKDIITVKKKMKSYKSSYKLMRAFATELSWTQYSVYVIYRQHQKYLQELYVQRLIVSMEPLNLSRCVLYNKLSDALVNAGKLTTVLVLYAIIEQVVAGVPETSSEVFEYKSQPTDFFFDESDDLEISKKKEKSMILVTPCLQCRNKTLECICEKLKENVAKSESLERGEWSSVFGEYIEPSLSSQNQNTEDETTLYSPEYVIPESYLDQALSEKLTEKDFRNKKKWEAPSLCFFGDSIFLETTHLKCQLFNTETLVERFLINSDFIRIWDDYPQPPPENRAFYNYHFQLFKKMSKKNEEDLKLHLYFAVLMKMIGGASAFKYIGNEETFSDMEDESPASQLSKIQFEMDLNDTDIKNNFSRYFIRNFICGEIRARNKKNALKVPIIRHVSGTLKKSNYGKFKQIQKSEPPRPLGYLRKSRSETTTTFTSESDLLSNQSSSDEENVRSELQALTYLLNCYELSSITLPNLLTNKEEFINMVENFKFYEKFEPYIMIQRLFEARDDFRTTQTSYFPITDSIFIIMYDDYDHRGLSYVKTNQILPTPVYFRDFYTFFYGIIEDWLIKEFEEGSKFAEELQEKAKAEAEESDWEYLSKLNKCYYLMNNEEKQRFLETNLENEEIEITEEELKDLPVKPKPLRPNKVSFVVTNYMNLWVEFTRKMHEFKSLDGTEVNVKEESWSYTPLSLIRVRVRLLHFELYYNQRLGEEKIETSFVCKTKSDIIFSFYKTEQEEEEEEEEEGEEVKEEGKEKEQNGDAEEKEKRFNYHVTVSWPTGLIIQPVTLDSTTYIRQSYLKIYRKDWEIKEETSRCFVKNGQVVIFNEYGGYEILSPSGTRYTFPNATAKQKYEIISTTGEVWEAYLGRCKNKKYLLSTMKVLIGEDKEAQEIFYKREDGVYCLLWPNGKLVTTFPDGTKITTTPDFDENEISVEWTEEEKLWLKELQWKNKSEESLEKNVIISRSSIKHKISFSDKKIYENEIDENFILVTCSYLIEHPKYSTVYYNSEEDNIRLTVPEDINLYVYPGGNYVLKKRNTFVKVFDTTVEACKECPECNVRTTINLFLHEDEILCKCVDVNKKVFLLYRNGKTMLEEDHETSEEKPNISTISYCIANHNKSEILKQRCFALERDLSGVEFLHADAIAMYADKLSDNTYYDINTEDPSNMCHTFSCPYYKVGSEKWVMKYENENDSLPTNLKKNDLKELGVKEVIKNFFKYPFAGKRECGDRQQTGKPKENVEMPKLIVVRTIWAWPEDPNLVNDEVKENLANYENESKNVWNKYRSHSIKEKQSLDSMYISMRLRKIALTLNQSLQMYPHLCTQYPSTEKEIHYFGHFINTMEEMKSHFKDLDFIPDCKQIPIPLPTSSDLTFISEESDSPRST